MTTQTPVLLDAALAYAARGWPVFPCHTPVGEGCSCRQQCGRIGKHPRWAYATRHGLKDATADEATIRSWWQRWPQANIAIATGAVSGLVVLDDDSYKGGDESLRELEQTYTPVPETVLSLTGGGGVQYFFQPPGIPVKNGVESLGVGLDIRGDGGYVIAPPSLHASGKRYVWEVLHEPDDTPLAPMPAWLLALCQETTRRETVDAGAPIPDGQRGGALFKLGCAMRGRGFTHAAILGALEAINATQCQPPVEAARLAAIATRCAAYPAGDIPADAVKRRNGTAPPPSSDPASLGGTADEDYPYSDAYNALHLIRAHGHEMKYCAPWKSWLTWCGSHWQRDTVGLVVRWQRETVKALGAQLPGLEDEAAKKLLAHIKSSLNTARLKAAVEQAHTWDGMTIEPNVLDADPWVLNCTNGTLDLHSGELRPHRQADLITKCLSIAYEPDATCPTWDAFLWRIMGGRQDPDDPNMRVGELERRRLEDERPHGLIDFLQRAIGYTLTGSTREQCLFMLHGPTKTGKSTFLATLRALLGPYGQQADMESFMHKDRQEVRNDIADLAGSRLVCTLEVPEGKRLAENLVKQMTGGADQLKARFLFEEHFTFKPQFKIFLGTNHKPKANPGDDALWERIHLVPFVVQIPKDDRDKELETKLRTELPGILAWAVRGCLAWQRLGDLGEPEAVIEATAGYRSEMDTLGAFLTECCICGDPEIYKTQASTLLQAYQRWVGQTTMTARALNSALSDRGYASKRFTTGMFWLGIGLPAPEEQREAK
jgi:putative DNA primase/helicase